MKNKAWQRRLHNNKGEPIEIVMKNLAQVAIYFSDLTMETVTETPAYIVSICHILK